MDRIEFLENRKNGIGGSDVAAIMGLSKWNTPVDIWEAKTGRAEVSDEMNDACYWGTEMEATLVTEFEKQTGLKVQIDIEQRKHEKYPWMMGNLDGFIHSEGVGLECKTAGQFMASEWGEVGSDEIPVGYYLQVQHYMCVFDIPMFYVIVSIGGQRPVIYKVHRDQDCIDKIIATCAVFWNTYVVKDERPPMQDEDKARVAQAVASVKGSSLVYDDAELASNLELLRSLKAEEKEVKSQIKETAAKIQTFMGENENLISSEGKVSCTWKSSTTNRLDTKALKEEMPGLYEKYCKESVSRKFLVKK